MYSTADGKSSFANISKRALNGPDKERSFFFSLVIEVSKQLTASKLMRYCNAFLGYLSH